MRFDLGRGLVARERASLEPNRYPHDLAKFVVRASGDIGRDFEVAISPAMRRFLVITTLFNAFMGTVAVHTALSCPDCERRCWPVSASRRTNSGRDS